MKILSLDYGYKRIGVSVGEIKVGIAFPRDILFNDKRDFSPTERALSPQPERLKLSKL